MEGGGIGLEVQGRKGGKSARVSGKERSGSQETQSAGAGKRLTPITARVDDPISRTGKLGTSFIEP